MIKPHFILIFFLLLPQLLDAKSSIKPGKLFCEYLTDPVGIDSRTPVLRWTLISDERNQRQYGYDLIVSDNPDDIRKGIGNMWSSQDAITNRTDLAYAGKALESLKQYFWSVRVYDNKHEASEWSAPASFETAMLNETDWSASWIGDGSKQFERDEDFYKDDRMPLFRGSFKIKGNKIRSARLYITGLGYYEAYLNGAKVGSHVLDPGWTTYKKQVLYVVHDVTSMLKAGDNVAGIGLGNGWFNPLPLRLFSRFNLRDVQQTGRPCVKAEIHIRYSDGSRQIMVTDENWQTAPGPVVRNNVYLGEYYDARLEQSDWLTNRVSGNAWKSAVKVEGPAGSLSVQMQPPIRITKVIKPIAIREISTGVFIVDMGQNFAGVARIKVKGSAGTQIKLRYGEDVHADGKLNYLTSVAGQIKEMWKVNGGPGSPPTAWQEDRYTLKGKGTEVWSPAFTFHGFRYVEVIGWPGKPDLESIEGLRMNSDLSPAGEFACSNEMFNRLHSVINRTFLSNVFSVQSDCPGREKMGYGADVVVTSNSFIFNFDMANFYRKTVRDFANEQQADGGITEIAPYTGIADRGYGGESGPLGWQLAFPYLQKQLYTFYGDKKIIADNYAAFQKQMLFLQSKAIDGLFQWDISDHEAIDPKPEAFTASAFYYHHALLAAEFAGILKKKEDSVRYASLAAQIKQNIVRKYLVPNTGRFDNATQSAQLFALWYQLSPETELTFDVLMNEFKRHKNHVSSGIFGVMFMFDVLRQWDRNDVAYAVASQADYPGWGYMISKGATTLWEEWAYPENGSSQNHPMFGTIDEWFYRSLLGINPALPGFEKIQIKPQPAGDLTWAKGSYESIKGKISSEWKIRDGMYFLSVSIPANTTAEVWIRSKEDGRVLEGNKEIKMDRYEKGFAVLNIGSGSYVFSSTPD